MDLMEELERAIGDGPAHRPVEARIRAGRRALLRRRAGAAVAGVAVVATLGTTYAVAGPGRGEDATGQVASTAAPTPTPTEQPSARTWEDKTPARYAPDGELEIAPGVVVHQHLENPFGYEPPRQSDALDLTFGGQRMWVILEGKPGAYGFSSSAPSNGWASFEDYVADQVGGGTDTNGGWPDTLRLAGDGRVVAAPGSEILQRTDDPQLGSSFAAPGDPTGAALVRVGTGDTVYFVVWRVVDGKLDVVNGPRRDVGAADFDRLLAQVREQYASGEGLR